MAASSPYTPNDYAAVDNYRPYQLPINEIGKAISAQDTFWEQGAARVKSVYDNALNLQLSIEPNKEIRKKFMEEADKQITKLSSMDLSDPSVQRQGFNIYKPLFEDEGIVYDDLMTRHYGKVRGDALSYRSKDNGKGYSDTNLSYALDGYSEFVNSQDRMAGKKFYQSRKEYTPYYDYTAEANVVLKNCPPNQATGDHELGLNIVEHSSKGLSSAKLNGCLDTGLSPQAKKQLSIDGYVTYKNNLPALRDAYVPSLQNTKAQLQEESAAYEAILVNKDKLGSLTEEQLQKIGLTKDAKNNPDYMDVTKATPQYLASLDQKKKGNELRVNNLNQTLTQLLNNDFSSISGENFEPVAGNVYAKSYMDAYAIFHAYTNEVQKIKGNPSQMLIYRENREDARQNNEHEFQLQKAEMTLESQRQTQLLKLKLKGGKLGEFDITDNRQLNTAFGETDVDKSKDYDKITQERNNIADQRASLNEKLFYRLKEWGMNSVTREQFAKNDPVYLNWYNAFTRTLPKDDPKWDDIHKFENQQGKLVVNEDINRNVQNEVDAQLKKTNPELFNRGFIKNFKPVDGVSAEDMQNAIEGMPNGAGLQIKKELYYPPNGAPTEVATIYRNGKRLDDNSPLRNFYTKLYQANNTSNESLADKRNELAKTKTILQKEGYLFPELDVYDPKAPDSFKGRMLQNLGLNPKEGQTFITVGQTDLRGHVEITIQPPNSASSPTQDEILNAFKNKYGVSGDMPIVQGKGKNKYHFIVTVPELDKFNDPELSMSDYMAPYLRTIEKTVSPALPRTTGLVRSMDPTKSFGVRISSAMTGPGYKYEVYTQDGSTVGTYDNRLDALEVFNRNLGKDKQ